MVWGMARKLRMQFEGGIYHVTFRGNARQDIFTDDGDRQRLKERMEEAVGDFGVRMLLYCFMNNHVHLLVETPGGNLSRFMSSVLTGYTVYFNRRHKRAGHLMQGRYGSQVVEGDEYLLKLSRYIHLNPVRRMGWKQKSVAERGEYLRKYKWSSYRGYVGLEKPEEWITYGPLWAMVPGGGKELTKRCRVYMEMGLVTRDEEIERALSFSSLAIGSEAFREQVHMAHEERAADQKRREDVSLRNVRRLEKPVVILTMVSKMLDVSEKDLCRKRRDGTARALAAMGLMRHCGMTQREVAERLGMTSGSSVGWLLRRLKEKSRTDKGTMKQARMISKWKALNSYLQG